MNSRITLDNWGTFLSSVIIYTIIYCLGMYKIALNQYEKDIIWQPIQKMKNVFIHTLK